MTEKLSKELLEVLACPQCKGSLEYNEKQNFLLCHNCKLKFKVKEGIPVMLLEEAERI
jgi:uncharacterized protein YbaR (Trm112 family)